MDLPSKTTVKLSWPRVDWLLVANTRQSANNRRRFFDGVAGSLCSSSTTTRSPAKPSAWQPKQAQDKAPQTARQSCKVKRGLSAKCCNTRHALLSQPQDTDKAHGSRKKAPHAKCSKTRCTANSPATCCNAASARSGRWRWLPVFKTRGALFAHSRAAPGMSPGAWRAQGPEVCSWRSAGGPSQRRQPGRKRPVSAAMCAGPSPQQPPKAVTPCCCQPCARVTKSSGEMVSTKLQSGILK